jgi:hypothetical protein
MKDQIEKDRLPPCKVAVSPSLPVSIQFNKFTTYTSRGLLRQINAAALSLAVLPVEPLKCVDWSLMRFAAAAACVEWRPTMCNTAERAAAGVRCSQSAASQHKVPGPGSRRPLETIQQSSRTGRRPAACRAEPDQLTVCKQLAGLLRLAGSAQLPPCTTISQSV